MTDKAKVDAERVKEIEEREKKATSGPWGRLYCVSHWVVRSTENDEGVAEVSHDFNKDADADFIAHARTDIPFLLTLYLSQAAQIQEGRTALEKVASEIKAVMKLEIDTVYKGDAMDAQADSPTWNMLALTLESIRKYLEPKGQPEGGKER